MLKGIDFSSGGGLTATQIKDAGNSFVCRYLSGGGPKDIDSIELANYKAAGIAVVFVFETGGYMPSEAQGVTDARTAQAELERLASAIHDSSVSSAPVFFAADAASEADLTGYMQGVASVIGKARTGIYGGLNSIRTAFNAGLVTYGWQTYAWSAGQWDNRALLRQYQNNVRLGPATVDLDEAAYWSSTKILGTGDDFGQWPRPAPSGKWVWEEWTCAGDNSFAQHAQTASLSVTTLLYAQFEHFGSRATTGLWGYFQRGDLNANIPNGVTIYTRVFK